MCLPCTLSLEIKIVDLNRDIHNINSLVSNLVEPYEFLQELQLNTKVLSKRNR